MKATYLHNRNYLAFQKKYVTNKLIFWINYKLYCLLKPEMKKALEDGYKL